jgi:hypothetical protein
MSNSRNDIQSGPYGGSGGASFSDELPDGARIIEVLIRHGEYVDGIQLVWQLADGSGVFGPYHGGQGGEVDSFILAPGEVIELIHGRSGDLVDSLAFQTSFGNSYGPYGGGGGTPFVEDFRAEPDPEVDHAPGARASRALTGIFGQSGDLLDAIGFWIDLEFTGG